MKNKIIWIIALSVFVADMIFFTPVRYYKSGGFSLRDAFFIFDPSLGFILDLKAIFLDVLIIGAIALISILIIGLTTKKGDK